MTSQTFWIIDPDTGEERSISYQELEDDTLQRYFIRPIGGFIFPANLFTLKSLPGIPFYVKDWLPKRGKAVLYGHAKAGKSYLCLQLSRCIGCGEPFLGLPTTKGTVLYVQFELGEEILQHRMKEETRKDYTNVFVGTTFSMKLDTKQGQGQLERALQAVEPNVLILDPKIKIITGDENESHDMQPICDFLDTMIECFNCSILIIDHAGKDLGKRGRGSTIWEGWSDSYLEIKRMGKRGEPLKVKIEARFLRHASLSPEPIEAELGEDFEFHVVSLIPTVKTQTEAFLKATSNWLSPKDLFDAHIGSNTSVYQALKELVDEGKVEKEGRGQYRYLGT